MASHSNYEDPLDFDMDIDSSPSKTPTQSQSDDEGVEAEAFAAGMAASLKSVSQASAAMDRFAVKAESIPKTQYTPPVATREEIFRSAVKKNTKMALQVRDRNAVEYLKNALVDGDTLVIIKYPNDSDLFHPSGFKLFTSHRVDSAKLLGTSSPIFSKLLSDWDQHLIKKRNGYLGGRGLLNGVKYVLNLTPPDEGDEAVELTSNLSCSSGIRNWCTAVKRFGVQSSLVAGKDEVCRPKSRHSGAFNLTDDENQPATSSPSVSNQALEPFGDEGVDLGSSTDNAFGYPAPGTSEAEDKDLRRILEESRFDYYRSQNSQQHDGPSQPGDAIKQDILEYCPIRHRSGIVRLLQIIEGKDPQLDSAPKVWTLFGVAQYFGCTEVVTDFIVSWMTTEPNCRIIELLPEATYKIGLGLKSPTLTRPAFAILVSEAAMSLVSRGNGKLAATTPNTTAFGRIKEDVDEDELNRIQAAANDFHSRIQNTFDELISSKSKWFQDLSEFNTIMTFEAENVGDDKAIDTVEHLVDALRHYVRGRIASTLTESLPREEVVRCNNQRRAGRADTFVKDFGLVYDNLTLTERIMTRPFWQMVKGLQFSTQCRSNLIYDYNKFQGENFELAKEMGIADVSLAKVQIASDKLNDVMLKKKAATQSHNSIVPPASLPSFSEPPQVKKKVATQSQNVVVPPAWLPSFSEPPQEWSPRANRLLNALDTTAARFSLPIRARDESPTTAEASTFESSLPIRTKPESSVAAEITAPESPTLGFLHEGDVSSLSPLIPNNASSRALYASSFVNLDLDNDDDDFSFRLSRDPFTRSVNPPYFSLNAFLRDVQEHVYSVCCAMLSAEQLDYNHVTDTLVSLTDAEFKYLPLWAGGMDDGSGGVFEVAVPPTDMGPNGPGPVFHTGYSVASSRASSVVDVGSDAGTESGVGTSVRVENGYSDHVDRRVVMSDFGSEDGEVDDEEEADFSGGEEESWDGDMDI